MGRKKIDARAKRLFFAVMSVARDEHGGEVPDYVEGILNGIAACAAYLGDAAEDAGLDAEALARNTVIVTRNSVGRSRPRGVTVTLSEVRRHE